MPLESTGSQPAYNQPLQQTPPEQKTAPNEKKQVTWGPVSNDEKPSAGDPTTTVTKKTGETLRGILKTQNEAVTNAPVNETYVRKGFFAKFRERIHEHTSVPARSGSEARINTAAETASLISKETAHLRGQLDKMARKQEKAEAKAAVKAEAAQDKAKSQQKGGFQKALEWGEKAAMLREAQINLSAPPPEGKRADFVLADRFGFQSEIDQLTKEMKSLEKEIGKLLGTNGLSSEAKQIAKEYGRAFIGVNSSKPMTLEERSNWQQSLTSSQNKLRESLSHPSVGSAKQAPTPEDIRKADAARFRPSSQEDAKSIELKNAATDLVRLTRIKEGLLPPDVQKNGQDVTSANMLLAKDTVSTLSRELFEACGKDKERFAKLCPDVKPDGSLSDAKKAEIKKEVEQAKEAAKASKSEAKTHAKETENTAKAQAEWDKSAEERTNSALEYVRVTNQLMQLKARQTPVSDKSEGSKLERQLKDLEKSRSTILSKLGKEYEGDKIGVTNLIRAAISYVRADEKRRTNNEEMANGVDVKPETAEKNRIEASRLRGVLSEISKQLPSRR